MIRLAPHYRREAVLEGLEAYGFKVQEQTLPRIERDDVLVIWNRYGIFEEAARRFEAANARVIVMENGYLGHDEQGRQYYALSLFQHNGAGFAPEYGYRRRINGVELEPWRDTDHGDEVVILAQRGIGSAEVRQPDGWLARAVAAARQIHPRVRVREHPGTDVDSAIPLLKDCERAKAVVTWASGAALKCLVAGIPAYYGLPGWVGSPAARSDFSKEPKRRHRGAMMRRVAFRQWTVDEIASGEAFRHLLKRASEEFAAEARS